MASQADQTVPGEARRPPRRTPTVVVTRPRSRAAGMVASLQRHGCRVLHLPTIEITPPEDPSELTGRLGRVETYDWVVMTSVSAVRAVAGARPVEGSGGPPRPEGAPRRPPLVAAVGRATATAVEKLLGWPVALVPERFTAEGLLEAFDRRGGVEGARVLLPLADRARDVLPRGLAHRGARVDRVVAYRTVPPDEADVAPVRDAVEAGAVDLLTFTSPSTAESFLELLGEAALDTPVAAIGPVTGDAAEALGYQVVVVAASHTAEGLVEAAIRYLDEERPDPPEPEART